MMFCTTFYFNICLFISIFIKLMKKIIYFFKLKVTLQVKKKEVNLVMGISVIFKFIFYF